MVGCCGVMTFALFNGGTTRWCVVCGAGSSGTVEGAMVERKGMMVKESEGERREKII